MICLVCKTLHLFLVHARCLGMESASNMNDSSSTQRFKDGVRQLSNNRKHGYKSSKESLLYLSKHADPQKQKEALAGLVAEEPQTLMEITDRYISERGERSAFLGFLVTDDVPSSATYQVIPSVQAMTKRTRKKYNAALKKRSAAGSATILDSIGTIDGMEDPFFLPKESIVLGNERSIEHQILLKMLTRAETTIAECVCTLRKKISGFGKYLHPRKYKAVQEEIEDTQAIFRIFHDTTCQLQSALYCESLGCPLESWRLHELEDRYFERLDMISTIRKENA